MPDDIHQPKQLLVEGKDAKVFFIEFLKALDISDIQVQDFGGVNELTGFLGQLRKNANFRKMVTSLGIVRDAESDSIGAFQSVQTSLQKASLPVPSNLTIPTNTSLKVNIFILPGNNSPGMLETLLLQAVSSDPAVNCIDSFIECIESTYCPLAALSPACHLYRDFQTVATR